MNGFVRQQRQRVRAQLASKAFVIAELARAYASRRPPMRILFADRDGWTETIRRKFRLVRDTAFFGNISTSPLEDYDLVVPLTIEDQVYLDSVRDRIPGNAIPIPDPRSIRLCDDKPRFNRYMAEHGFSANLPQGDDDPAFPYVLKKRIDEAGRHCHVVLNRTQETALADLRRDPDYFTQAWIPGPVEYATHLLYRQGRVVCSLNVEYGFDTDTPVKGRDEPVYACLGRCRHLQLFTSMLDAIGFEGLCCFNYKLQAGRPLVFEVNPRFGRSLCGYFFAFVRHLAPLR